MGFLRCLRGEARVAAPLRWQSVEISTLLMKTNNIRSITSILTAGFLAFSAASARALTADEIAGIYKGTSTATLANGVSITASVTITLKPN